MSEDQSFPPSPFAKYRGELPLGDSIVDCYVLDTEDRVISLRTTVKSLTGIDGSALEEYIGYGFRNFDNFKHRVLMSFA